MNYWVAHIRGAEFADLEKLGFKTFYPYSDDYAFLPVTEKNKKLLSKEFSLKVFFLRTDNILSTVSDEDLQGLTNATICQIRLGALIEIIDGPYAQMSGHIEGITDDIYHCIVKSYGSKIYEVDLERSQFIIEGDH